MKNNHPYRIAGKGFYRNLFILIVTGTLVLFNHTAIAQETKDSVSVPAEQTSKLSFTMNVKSMISNDIRSVKVLLSRKENKKSVIVNDVKAPFNLYLNEVKVYDSSDGTGLIGKLKINYEGEGIFVLPVDFYKHDSALHTYSFIITMNDDPKYEDIEETITITDAKIKVEYAGEDSLKSATATLMGWKDNGYVPVPGAELKLTIKRTFNSLPFSEAGVTTDSSGQVSGDLPLDLPGNADGTITILGMLEDDETYGTVETGISVPWAVLPKKNVERGRTLWSSGDNAPLILVFSSLLIIAIIWGTIFYLIRLLFKIKKLGKSP